MIVIANSNIGIGIVGYGYWGPNLVRNFSDLDGARVVGVCDMNPKRMAVAQKKFPGVGMANDFAAFLKTPGLDAVCVATPVNTHFKLARAALEAGKHVLVEKPLASSTREVRELIAVAERKKLVLLVDHTFIYTGAVRKIREMVAGGELGKIQYYDSVRVNLGLFQHDVNVLWDLAIHDLAIMDFVLGEHPLAVSATGLSHVPGQPENVAYLTLFYESNLIAHINVNWLAPAKVRRTLIGGSKKMIVYDDLEPSEKLKVYDKGISFHQNQEKIYEMLISYRTGDAWLPKLDTTEALTMEARHFLDCIMGKTKPLSGGEVGLATVAILEAATKSLKKRGQPVEIDVQSLDHRQQTMKL
jgi:predicted dehydrogenase